MTMERIKVVWICSLSNSEIREHLKMTTSVLEPLFRKIVKRDDDIVADSAIWNTNGINEIKHIPNVELHVVGVARNLTTKRQDFDIEGIHYHFVRDENSSLVKKVKRYLFTRYKANFIINRKHICEIVKELNPDIVHVIGAENPQYSLALLDLPDTTPIILQLQALLASVVDKTTGQRKKEYQYKAQWEKKLVQRADFIGTRVPSYIEYLRKEMKSDAKIIDITLAMAQTIDLSVTDKVFDFVHYAATLGKSKATDIALEAFGIAHKKHPEITLDIIGGIPSEFRDQLDRRIRELGIESAVTFEGKLPTHDDVIKQMRKSRFALLPLKVSIVPNTLHEVMANGLPVITTVTPGTPKLNANRESVLISPPDDVLSLADNMIHLLEDPELAEKLRQNAAITEQEHDNNRIIIQRWVELYNAIYNYHNYGIEIPDTYLL